MRPFCIFPNILLICILKYIYVNFDNKKTFDNKNSEVIIKSHILAVGMPVFLIKKKRTNLKRSEGIMG